jgi:hypothetical protein
MPLFLFFSLLSTFSAVARVYSLLSSNRYFFPHLMNYYYFKYVYERYTFLFQRIKVEVEKLSIYFVQQDRKVELWDSGFLSAVHFSVRSDLGFLIPIHRRHSLALWTLDYLSSRGIRILKTIIMIGINFIIVLVFSAISQKQKKKPTTHKSKIIKTVK